jgi:hypothetical protein
LPDDPGQATLAQTVAGAAMTLARLSPLVLATVLSGCIFIPIPAPPGAPGAITIIPEDPCGARSVSNYRGATEAQVRGTNFAAPGPVRILTVGQPATTDLIENRLNFIIGADGLVSDITCG